MKTVIQKRVKVKDLKNGVRLMKTLVFAGFFSGNFDSLFWFLDYEPIKLTVKGTLKEVEKLTKLK